MASVSVCEEPLYPIITSCLLCVTRDNWRHSANYQVTAEPERGRERERERTRKTLREKFRSHLCSHNTNQTRYTVDLLS